MKWTRRLNLSHVLNLINGILGSMCSCADRECLNDFMCSRADRENLSGSKVCFGSESGI